MSFLRIPSEAKTQNTYPQINNPKVRLIAYPRPGSAGNNRYGIGNDTNPIIVINKYQMINVSISKLDIFFNPVDYCVLAAINLFPKYTFKLNKFIQSWTRIKRTFELTNDDIFDSELF